MKQAFDNSAPSGLPDAFYIGLASSPIAQGRVTVAITFDNNTEVSVTVSWTNSHLYRVMVTDAVGDVFNLETVLPPAQPNQPPTIVDPRTTHTIVYPVDTSLAPYAGVFAFDKVKSPYTFSFALNSPSHPYTLTAAVPVVA